MIQDALKAQGLPLDLAYIPIVESAFHTTALSRAKAKGFWQLMRGTAVEQGLKHDWYIDERANPERATAAAVRYLKVLNKMFGGDWHLTLASYNGGPGKVQRAVKRKGGDADFWRLAEKGRYLPRETREYVPMVLAAMVVARNPGQYGFTLDSPSDAAAPSATPPAPSETVELPGPVDLRRIAEWAGVPVEDVQRLNPELRRLTTPLRGAGYPLRVPGGTATAVAAQLAATSPDDLVAFQYHTVKKNESLTSIANKLRVRRADLAEANYLSVKSRVKPGDRLVIPRAATTVLASRSDTKPEAVSAAGDAAPRAATATPAPSTERTKTTYRVRKGDTLASIARAHRTTVDALRELNRLKSSRLMPGDRLTVYARRGDGGQRP
jgi:membrane-bound lytic murein transglycosylase D